LARSQQDNITDDLFINLAEQVRLPLLQILHEVELMKSRLELPTGDPSSQRIALSSDSALRLIDGYLLSVSLQREQQLQLEPVSLSSTVYDVAEVLDGYAKANDCGLELHIAGKYGPVHTHYEAIRTALISLGFSFIEAVSRHKKENRIIRLSVRKNKGGINTGLFSKHADFTSTVLQTAKQAKGFLHQPLATFDSGTSSGLFIADTLFHCLSAPLKVSRNEGIPGLAATLLPSRQLNLV
jgi:hypothetical protein